MHVQTYNVLLVEDVMLIAKITLQMLKKAPSGRYVTVHHVSLAAARTELQAREFDVVLLDLNLPDSRDLETLSRVLEIAPDLPIVVLTATDSNALGLQAVQLGAQDYLMKGEFNYQSLDRSIMYAIERHRMQRTIRQLAVLDELTGLYNRRGFNTLNPDLLQQARRSAARGFLCFFDLDRFKQINDALGHAKGDEALAEFAATLRSVFRKDTLLVRLGGDEFVAMGLEQQPGQAAEMVGALQIMLSVRNAVPGQEFALEASAGLAYFDRNGPASLEAVTAQADAALYRDKQERRQARAESGLGSVPSANS